MCLISFTNCPQKATEDITCYKLVILQEDPRNWFQKLFHRSYIKYKTPIMSSTIVNKQKILLSDFSNVTQCSNIFFIYKGLHSFVSLDECKKQIDRYKANTILKCIIPKESLYYTDTFNREYCSNQLIIKQEII